MEKNLNLKAKNGRLRGNRLFLLTMVLAAAAGLAVTLWLVNKWEADKAQAGEITAKNSSSQTSAPAGGTAAAAALQASSAASAPQSGAKGLNSTSIDKTAFFGKSLFLGDSITLGLKAYQILPGAEIIGTNGMSTFGALKGKVEVDGSEISFLDEVAAKKPLKVFLLLGTNDITYMTKTAFIKYYGQLIDGIKEKSPRSKIFVQSVFPVTSAIEAKKPDVYSNVKIDEYNAALKQLCGEKSVLYADVASILKGSDGKMAAENAGGGINVNLSAYYRWMNYLSGLE